ncbi:hypothetical protein [Mucilaginibacter sp. UR6-11]|uniref:hypothetical protein n=1 Tax=Mucilaginibacter sp. UR6-11 TaxID=1435644 RepID=UPI001E37AC41|nr:hypothetical protein [Mucilaginibacter sp. UR6-11]MCC8425029.1 hypothetical protein [Mucilaginibacter sp. UR6-11]
MKHSFFYFKKLTGWNIAGLAGYILFSLFGYGYCSLFTPDELPQFLLGDILVMQGLLYLLGYKKLRNMTVFFCWCAVGLMQVLIYFLLKDNPALKVGHLSAVVAFRNTIPLLLLFQSLRFLYFKIQGRELIMLSKLGQKDMYDNRESDFFDVISFIIYFSAMIYLSAQ